jgi:hypothetical protein
LHPDAKAIIPTSVMNRQWEYATQVKIFFLANIYVFVIFAGLLSFFLFHCGDIVWPNKCQLDVVRRDHFIATRTLY